MKKFFAVLIVCTLAFAACDNGNGTTSSTTLRIRNQSSKTISAVIWNDVSFATKENADVIGTWTGTAGPADYLTGTIRLTIGDKSWAMSDDYLSDGGTWTRNGTNFTFQSSDRVYGLRGTAILFNGTLTVNVKDRDGISYGTYVLSSNNLDNSINPGASAKKTVEDGSGYIYFKIASVSYRTNDLVSVEKNDTAEFSFTSNTLVVAVDGPNTAVALGEL